jgi:hypothetical protein
MDIGFKLGGKITIVREGVGKFPFLVEQTADFGVWREEQGNSIHLTKESNAQR